MRLILGVITLAIFTTSTEAGDCSDEYDTDFDSDMDGYDGLENKGITNCEELFDEGDSTTCIVYQALEEECPCVCEKLEDGEKKQKDDDNDDGSDGDGDDDDDGGDSDGGSCFFGDDTVLTQGGAIKVKDIAGRLDDKVLTVAEDGKLRWTPIKLWLHADPTKVTQFIEAKTNTATKLSLTPLHLALVKRAGSDTNVPVFAKDLKIGDLVTSLQKGTTQITEITNTTAVTKTGIYSFVTEEGTVVVNDVLVSCYSDVDDQVIQGYVFKYLHFLWRLPIWGSATLGADLSTRIPLSKTIYGMIDSAKMYL